MGSRRNITLLGGSRPLDDEFLVFARALLSISLLSRSIIVNVIEKVIPQTRKTRHRKGPSTALYDDK
jgi:hypothetical protein